MSKLPKNVHRHNHSFVRVMYPLFLSRTFTYSWEHGTIMRIGITCKKIPCYMCDSARRWFIVKKAKPF